MSEITDGVTLYICADATLTYGPLGGTDKIIPQALPLCTVRDAEEAMLLIALTGALVPSGPYRKHADVAEGYGPPDRYHYTLKDFRRGDWSTVTAAGETMAALRDATRAKDAGRTREIFAKSAEGSGGLEVPFEDKVGV